MSGFFTDVNQYLANKTEGTNLRLEKIECVAGPDGKQALSLYFNRDIFIKGNDGKYPEYDVLQDYYTMFHLQAANKDVVELGEPIMFPTVMTAVSGNGISLLGPKQDILKMLRIITDVVAERHSYIEDIYQSIDLLSPGQTVSSDEELQILKATGKLPKTEGRPL